jgi:hypothetical protein
MIPNPAAALAAVSLAAFLLLVPGELLAAARKPVRARGGPGGKGRGGSGPGDGGPADLPDAPAWSLAGGEEIVDFHRAHSEAPPAGDRETPELRAINWDSLRSVARAVAGPDDPRVWAAAARAAAALAKDRDRLGAAAALAAGALEGLERLAGTPADEAAGPAGDAAGPAGYASQALLRETLYARNLVAALGARLERAGQPVPPPAYCLEPLVHPGPDVPPVPCPRSGELRLELAAAELERGPGSREALVVSSRLGEALAGEAEPAGMPGIAGGTGDSPAREARDLLRSASGGLDALLGREHPDALDARERLARFLAGGTGRGLPPDPLPCELPPEEELREALAIYLETAAVRAAAAARAAGPGDSSGAPAKARRSKYAPAGPAPRGGRGASGASGAASRGRPGVPPAAPSAETVRLLARHGDEAAFGAAAGAAGCAAALGLLGMQEAFGPAFTMSDLEESISDVDNFEAAEAFRELWTAAASRLGKLSPASLRLASAFSEVRLSDMERVARLMHGRPGHEGIKEQSGPLALMAHDRAESMRKALGAGAPETTRAKAVMARTFLLHGLPDNAAGVYAGLLDELEGCAPGNASPVRKIAPDRGGRDRLALRAAMAWCLCGGRYPASVTALLAPVLEALEELPPGGGWPWPPELAGRALTAAGETAYAIGDHARAEGLMRRALDALDPRPADPAYLATALDRLTQILAGRGDVAALREAAGLQTRAAELRTSLDGPGSPASLAMLGNAASLLEGAGDTEEALALHRKVLSGSARLKVYDERIAGRSRKAIERLGGQAR